MAAVTDALRQVTEAHVALSESFYGVSAAVVPLVAAELKTTARLRWTAQQLSRLLYPTDEPASPLACELSIRSQNGEDGILLSIFAALGMATGTAVELGAGDGTECTTGHLLFDRGWTGVLVDARPEIAATAFGVSAWVSAENVNDVIGRTDVDLLAIDLDGNDYWIWEAIDEATRPAVVVVEYNASFGRHLDASIPYAADFVWPAASGDATVESTVYYGASLAALTRLGATKGYALLGCESFGVNAFFVRDDIAGQFPCQSPEVAWRPNLWTAPLCDFATQHEALMQMPLTRF